MKLSLSTITAAALVVAATGLAQAEQYAIKTLEPVSGASAGLLASLDVREVGATRYDGVHYTIVEARNKAAVEAYAIAGNIDAKGLFLLEADWDGPGMSSLSVAAREPFLELAACGFCTRQAAFRPDELSQPFPRPDE